MYLTYVHGRMVVWYIILQLLQYLLHGLTNNLVMCKILNYIFINETYLLFFMLYKYVKPKNSNRIINNIGIAGLIILLIIIIIYNHNISTHTAEYEPVN